MKILKIFGLVVGIHVFALILIFANPGCSSTAKPPPAPADTVAQTEPANVAVPGLYTSPATSAPATTAVPPPVDFNPDAPALAAPASGGVRFTPTRPNTPAASTLIAEPVADVTPATTYTVRNGDNLWNLSKKFHISTSAIAAANNIRVSSVLHPGQKLIIPGKPASAPEAARANPAASAGKTAETITKAPAANPLKHVVKSGETLSGIAKQYGVTQAELGAANNIADPRKIRPGQELVIPNWQTPASRSHRASSQKSNHTEPAHTESAEPAPQAPEPSVPTIDTSAPPATTPPPEVPVIHIDDSPVTPVAPPPGK